MTPFERQFTRIVDLGRQDVKGPSEMGLKLMEEVGEYAEAINFTLGYLPHKTQKEPAIGEAADVIQNVICILGRLYPDTPPSQLAAELDRTARLRDSKRPTNRPAGW